MVYQDRWRDKDNVLNVLQQSTEKHSRFLQAWKRGVIFLGPHFFGLGAPETATRKEDLRPLKDVDDVAFEDESEGEEQFLAAMASFYDPAWGEELAALSVTNHSVG